MEVKRDIFDKIVFAVGGKISSILPVLIGVVIVFLAAVAWMYWAATSDGWAIWAGAAEVSGSVVPAATAAAGAWGDSFGPFNAFFAAVGSGAVITTLYLQHRALKEQRRDIHIQRFEETFFELISLMRELRENLRYRQTEQMRQSGNGKYYTEKTRTGHNAIKYAFYEVRHWIIINGKYTRGVVADEYDRCVHRRYESRFAPYFRIIYTILNNIKQDTVINDKQKAYYGNILRSQLTSYEIMLLAFNGASRISKDLSDLIEFFRMLKYVPPGRGRIILRNVYDEVSFMPRDGD